MGGMRMQKSSIVVLCLIVFALAWSTMAPAEDSSICIPLGSIELKVPEQVKAQRALVDFPHSVHFGYKCQDCHHKWDGGAKIQNCTVSGCHDQVVAPEKPLKKGKYTKEAIKYYKYAYHVLCRDCHKEIKLENEEIAKAPEKSELQKTGPTGCNECHPKHE